MKTKRRVKEAYRGYCLSMQITQQCLFVCFPSLLRTYIRWIVCHYFYSPQIHNQLVCLLLSVIFPSFSDSLQYTHLCHLRDCSLGRSSAYCFVNSANTQWNMSLLNLSTLNLTIECRSPNKGEYWNAFPISTIHLVMLYPRASFYIGPHINFKTPLFLWTFHLTFSGL